MEGKEESSAERSFGRKGFWVAVSIFVGAFVAHLTLISPALTTLQDDFSYSARIFSLDNFYDEESREYTGDQRSVTDFSYTTTQVDGGISTIKNIISVRSVDGEPIFEVDRTYGVDQNTGQHVTGYGDADRTGYLFAPQKLKKTDSFTYWHINYDGPAEMTYAGDEVIEGLRLYKFQSNYDGVNIDQTDQLTFLPEVGETKGVVLDPVLTIWIEPFTGYMVKYEDETTAYFYDLATNERLMPWNHFSNSFQTSSIRDHVRIAKQKKLLFLVADAVPIVIVSFLVVITLMHYGRKKIGVAVLMAALAGVSAYLGIRGASSGDGQVLQVVVVPWVSLENQAYVENIQGFKDGLAEAGYIEGKDVEYTLKEAKTDMTIQQQIARNIASDSFDLAYSLTTTGTKVLQEHIASIPVVFSIVTYPAEVGIIDSVVNSGNNFVGSRNWVPAATQLDNFLALVPNTKKIAFVHRSGEENSLLQFQEMKEAALLVGVEIVEIAADNTTDLLVQLEQATEVDSVYSACDTLVQGDAEQLIIAAASARSLPSFTCNISGAYAGDLTATAADLYLSGKLAGQKAALIFEGASPQSLTTDTTPRPVLVLNRGAVDRLGIIVPQRITSLVDVVVE